MISKLNRMSRSEVCEFYFSADREKLKTARTIFPDRPKGYLKATKLLKEYANGLLFIHNYRGGPIERRGIVINYGPVWRKQKRFQARCAIKRMRVVLAALPAYAKV